MDNCLLHYQFPSDHSARVDEKNHIFVVCSSLSSSTSGMGEERPCTASTAGEGCEAVFDGLRDLVQLSTSLIVSARGRLSVSGRRSAKTPVTIANAENTMPGTQLAYLPCGTIFKQVQQAVVRSTTNPAPVLRCNRRPKTAISLHSYSLDGSTGQDCQKTTIKPNSYVRRPICPN